MDTNVSCVFNILASCDHIHYEEEDEGYDDNDQHQVGVTQTVSKIRKYRFKVNLFRKNCDQVETVRVEKFTPENDFAILDTLKLDEMTNKLSFTSGIEL